MSVPNTLHNSTSTTKFVVDADALNANFNYLDNRFTYYSDETSNAYGAGLIGNYSVDQTVTPIPGATNVYGRLSMFANTIKNIKGVTNWYDSTPASINTIWGKFNEITGHSHTGAINDAPILPHSGFSGLSNDDHPQYTQKITLDQKGSIYVASSAGNLVGLTVGADNLTLLADSTTLTGVKWGDAPVFKRIYSNVLAAATTSVTISGLDGENDIEYELQIFLRGGHASGDSAVNLRINGDSGNNYTWITMVGISSGVSAGQASNTSSFLMVNSYATNGVGKIIASIYAKSGLNRAIMCNSGAFGSSSPETRSTFGRWQNTVNNITSLTIFGSDANALGIGTRIELYARRGS